MRRQVSTPSAPAFAMETPACLHCGSRDAIALIEAPDFSTAASPPPRYAVVRCRQCGLAFTSPRPAPEAIAGVYSEHYGPHQDRQAGGSRRRRSGWSRWMAVLRGRRQVAWQGDGRLLDFGCGAGSFLRKMYEDGWSVTGLDASPAMVEQIRRRWGLRALAGSLPHPELLPESLDVVTMWQSLEHVHQPLDVLREARRLLAPGGKLIVAVPNNDSRPFRRFGVDWYGLDLPRHLTHFTPATLRGMVERAGFQVERVRMVSHASWLQSSAVRAMQHGRGRPPDQLLTFRSVCRLVAWWQVLCGSSDAMTLTARVAPSS